MNKITPLFFFLMCILGYAQEENRIIARQGQVSFFSYTAVENIEATNNQVLSIINLEDNRIAVNMLMRAFVFKKALMEEHFNESYVESDIYPKLQFEGKIPDFDASLEGTQTKVVKGNMTFHGITKDVGIKTKIENVDDRYILSGEFEVGIVDYDIKVPALLARNIAKIIKILLGGISG